MWKRVEVTVTRATQGSAPINIEIQVSEFRIGNHSKKKIQKALFSSKNFQTLTLVLFQWSSIIDLGLEIYGMILVALSKFSSFLWKDFGFLCFWWARIASSSRVFLWRYSKRNRRFPRRVPTPIALFFAPWDRFLKLGFSDRGGFGFPAEFGVGFARLISQRGFSSHKIGGVLFLLVMISL